MTEDELTIQQQLLEERDRYKKALEYIYKHCGQVCGAYEICDHESCASSYTAWATADMTLYSTKESTHDEPDRSAD